MKTIFTLMLLLFFKAGLAQDKIYVHTATAENTTAYYTLIDHPDLNDSPDAAIVFVNNSNPDDTLIYYNNNVSALWYNGSQWVIYNEDFAHMVVGASFNIYIAGDPNDVITHVATAANTTGHVTRMDHPSMNGMDPGPFLAFSHYFNPNSVYNTGNYGQYYGGDNRYLYDEGFTSVPEGAAFKVLIDGSPESLRMQHVSLPSNISYNITSINAPELNGNHNATFVMSHHWGANGLPSQVYMDAVFGVRYQAGYWCIQIEDPSINFPENVVFDIIIAPRQVLGMEDYKSKANIAMFPNPVKETVNFSASKILENVNLYNLLGQKVMTLNGNSTNIKMDVSQLSTGVYMAKVKADGKVQNFKVIKE